MKRKIYLCFLSFLILSAMFVLTGCIPDVLKPDLVPVNPPGMAGFCNINTSGDLVVYIQNQGNSPAGDSHARVTFGQLGESIKPVQSIGIGETISVTFEIPAGCFNPDCGFEITADVTDEVNESNELNNSQTGNCLG